MYTDPGSGVYFTQLLLASALTAIYRFRARIKAMLVRSKARSDQ